MTGKDPDPKQPAPDQRDPREIERIPQTPPKGTPKK